jgi:hypothetical protein
MTMKRSLVNRAVGYAVAAMCGVAAGAADTHLYWGDTHLHTSYSVDAYATGNYVTDPDTAFRYARGLPILHPVTREKIRIERPLDFLVVADHAELLQLQVRLDDAGFLEGVARIREAIAAGACDFIMPDLMKCGGVTGWMRIAGQAEAASIPQSSHLFAEASAHVLSVTPTAHWLEFLDFAGAILAQPARIVDGTLTARGPGLGLEWDEAAVKKYLV